MACMLSPFVMRTGSCRPTLIVLRFDRKDGRAARLILLQYQGHTLAVWSVLKPFRYRADTHTVLDSPVVVIYCANIGQFNG